MAAVFVGTAHDDHEVGNAVAHGKLRHQITDVSLAGAEADVELIGDLRIRSSFCDSDDELVGFGGGLDGPQSVFDSPRSEQQADDVTIGAAKYEGIVVALDPFEAELIGQCRSRLVAARTASTRRRPDRG